MKFTVEQLKAQMEQILGPLLDQKLEPLKTGSAEWVKEILKTGMPPKPRLEGEKGVIAAKCVRSIAGAKFMQSQGNPVGVLDYAKRMYGEQDEVVKALASSVAADGGFVIPEIVSSEIIEFLRPASVVRRMNPMLVDLTTGTLPIPKLTGGAQFNWIGENTNIIKTQPGFGQAKLVAKKGGALIPISNDFLRRANPRADTMIRDDMVGAIGNGTDLAYIRGDGSADAPKGLRYWAPSGNVIAANATVNLANVTTDLGKLVLQLLNGNIRMLRPGWLMAPRTMVYLATIRDGNGNFAFRPEMLTGRLWTFPFAVTTN
jgi:HK97 family phage major capsid protein